MKYAYQIQKMYEEMSMEFCELNQMKKGSFAHWGNRTDGVPAFASGS